MDQTTTKPVYVGLFLSDATKDWVLEQIKHLGVCPDPETAFGVVVADHVTLAFRPSAEKINLVNPGTQIRIAIMAVAWNSSIMAAKVQTLMECDNAVPHITIAHHPEMPPKNSNRMFDSNHHQFAFDLPLYISGILDFFPRTVDDNGQPLNQNKE